MSNPTRSKAVKSFLNHHTHPDLAELYTPEMEVQVNVAQDGGERVDKIYKGRNLIEWTDNIQSWKAFRMPRNAKTTPEENDYEINFDLVAHCEAVGMTGWNWKQLRSVWVAYDFDAITGHSDKHKRKLEADELIKIKEIVSSVPWVTLRKSTSGSGLHLYVFIGCEVHTSNHLEHMALARAILGQLSALVNFDFALKVDVNGGNMWVWHRKMSQNNAGLSLIKSGVPLMDIPPNWKDHVDVIKGKRKRIVPFFVKETTKVQDAEALFDELSGQRYQVPLDEEHNRVLDWLRNNVPGGSYWDSDHWMLITHTFYLKQAYQALKLKGVFETLSTGKEYGADQNAFAYPVKDGAWSVYRYTPGVAEAQTWTQDGSGYTHCFYNRIPSLRTASLAAGATETEKAGFVFTQVKAAVEVLKVFGIDQKVPEVLMDKECTLRKIKDGRLLLEITNRNKQLVAGMEGWDDTKKSWKKIFSAKVETGEAMDAPGCDQLLRHVVTEAGDNYGWVIKSDGCWKQEPLEHIKIALEGEFSFKLPQIKGALGAAVMKPYTLVNLPFDVEYPPGRKWNKKAAKLRFEPSQNENLSFPTWLKVFNHLGRGLDYGIKESAWAKVNSVLTGADYLLIWAASLFQKPMEQLPYLFFYSEKHNTGKTTFHEALDLLMTSGCVRVDKALEPSVNFNGEMQHAILCVIEETDLNKTRNGASVAYNRIKDWVTTKQLPIHEKHKTPYMVPNSCHFVQCSNSRMSCPVFPGDSRITMIRVEELDPFDIIPKTKLLEQLALEASDFLAFILTLQVPPTTDRLNIPAIATEDKEIAEESNMSLVELFIKEECHVVDGEMVLLGEFYEKFANWMEPVYLDTWTKTYTGRHLPSYHPKGRYPSGGSFYVGNLSFTAKPAGEPAKTRLTCVGQVLVPLNGRSSRNGTVETSDAVAK